jgi:integrase
MGRLTDTAVKAIPAPPQGYKIYHDETVPGFGVRVTANGAKSFVLMHGNPRRRVTLGKYPLIGLADARRVAGRILAEQTLGKHFPGRLAFSEALSRFVAEKTRKNRPSTIREHERILTKYYPTIQRKNLDEITTDDITRTLDKLSATPGTSLHAFWSMRTFMRWCVKRRYIQHSPIEGLDPPAVINWRERVLSDEEVGAVWHAAQSTGHPFGPIVQLLLLTGQRRSEIGSLQHAWLDLDANTCTLPSTLTKNGRSHTFPIGDLSCALLQASMTASSSPFLFPARGSDGKTPFNGWSKAKAQLDAKANIEAWTLHDLRRTYATNLQRLGIRLEVIEALLNHISGTRAGIVGVYQRHRYEVEMREAVNVYESWLQSIIALA